MKKSKLIQFIKREAEHSKMLEEQVKDMLTTNTVTYKKLIEELDYACNCDSSGLTRREIVQVLYNIKTKNPLVRISY